MGTAGAHRDVQMISPGATIDLSEQVPCSMGKFEATQFSNFDTSTFTSVVFDIFLLHLIRIINVKPYLSCRRHAYLNLSQVSLGPNHPMTPNEVLLMRINFVYAASLQVQAPRYWCFPYSF